MVTSGGFYRGVRGLGAHPGLWLTSSVILKFLINFCKIRTQSAVLKFVLVADYSFSNELVYMKECKIELPLLKGGRSGLSGNLVYASFPPSSSTAEAAPEPSGDTMISSSTQEPLTVSFRS